MEQVVRSIVPLPLLVVGLIPAVAVVMVVQVVQVEIPGQVGPVVGPVDIPATAEMA